MGVDLQKEIKLSDLFRKRAKKAPEGAPKAPKARRPRKAKAVGKGVAALPQVPLMRAFDLMPKEVAREKKKGRLGLAQVLVALLGLAVVAGLASGYLFMSARATTNQGKVDDLRAKLAALEVPAEERAEANAALAGEGQTRATALAAALGGRVAWDRILRELSLVLPEDVWLTQLSASTPNAGGTASAPAASPAAAPNSLSLTGMAERQTSVARLLARLQSLPEFATVDLQSSSFQEGNDVYDFSIVATIAPGGTE
jgi:Tfp pilus assembly protein PilN